MTCLDGGIENSLFTGEKMQARDRITQNKRPMCPVHRLFLHGPRKALGTGPRPQPKPCSTFALVAQKRDDLVHRPSPRTRLPMTLLEQAVVDYTLAIVEETSH